MRATGEVMGIAESFGLAYYKAEEAAGSKLPLEGNVLITVADRDKRTSLVNIATRLKALGFKIYATEGTSHFLARHNIATTKIKRIEEGRPDIGDAIKNREIHLIINTPVGRSGKEDDSYIRKMAIQYKVPYITTMAAAEASVEGIEAVKREQSAPMSLQDYHKELLRLAEVVE
jgi:carbamoyl-phosphate synthase large subunit